MASSEGGPPRSIEAAKAKPGHVKSDQDLKEPLLTKRGSTQLATSSAPQLKYGGLPAFHLHPEGLGGKKLAAVWVT